MNNVPSVIYPPNKPLELEYLPAKLPVRYDHLLYIDTNCNDEFIVGHSSLVGIYWESVLRHYADESTLRLADHQAYHSSESTVSCGRFVDAGSALLVDDSGKIELVRLADECDWETQTLGVTFCDDGIEDVAVWKDGKFATCAGNCLNVWKIGPDSDVCLLHDLKNYHTGLVASVDVDKSENHVFASASHDRRVCLWDDRASDAHVSVLYRNEFAEMTSVSWNPSRSRTLVAGCRNGTVYGLDARQPGTECPTSMVCFEEAPVHALRFSQNGLVAVCGDSEEVVVLNANGDCRVVYRSSKEHTNYVRGLAWTSKGALYSCGFDKTISRHEMPAI